MKARKWRNDREKEKTETLFLSVSAFHSIIYI